MNKRNVVTAISSLTSLTAVGSAHAAGCLKGAVVGGVAGHVAGHHAVIGAVGGCIVGHHYAKEQEKERAVAVSQRPAVARS
jgi:outer membrane lipoprotein SlyB